MIVKCIYSLKKGRAVDVLDVARAPDYTVAIRNGELEIWNTRTQTGQARNQQVQRCCRHHVETVPGSDLLTPRERVALAQLVSGATSKEAGRALGISPRTVEFRRASLLKKYGAKNTQLICYAKFSANSAGNHVSVEPSVVT